MILVDPWRAVTGLGNFFLWMALGFALDWYGSRAGRRLALASLLSFLLAVSLKYVLRMPRPSLEGVEDPYGFPSVHSTSAFAGASVLALGDRRLAPLLALACLVAWSRVELGVHYPRDVVGGAALGLAIALAVRSLGPRGTRALALALLALAVYLWRGRGSSA